MFDVFKTVAENMPTSFSAIKNLFQKMNALCYLQTAYDTLRRIEHAPGNLYDMDKPMPKRLPRTTTSVRYSQKMIEIHLIQNDDLYSVFVHEGPDKRPILQIHTPERTYTFPANPQHPAHQVLLYRLGRFQQKIENSVPCNAIPSYKQCAKTLQAKVLKDSRGAR